MGHYNPLRRQSLRRRGEMESTDEDEDEETNAAEFAANEREISRRRLARGNRARREVEEQMRRVREVQEECARRAEMEAEMEEIRRRLTEMDTIENAYTTSQLDAERAAERAAEAMTEALDAQISGEAEAYALMNAWSLYESSWSKLDERIKKIRFNDSSKPVVIQMCDIPWPPDESVMLTQMAALERWTKRRDANEESKHPESSAAYRRAFKRASLRWHPDKFAAKFGKYLDPKHSNEICQRVQSISQIINDEWSSRVVNFPKS